MTITDSQRTSIGAKTGLTADLGGAAPLLGSDADLTPAQAADVARLEAMLEVAFLAAAADGEITDPEADNLGATLASWLGGELSDDAVEAVIERFMAALAADGRAARLAAAAARLDADARMSAYTLACVVTLCDLELDDAELDALGEIATALDLAQADAQRRFEEVQDHVEAVVANARRS
ncbi:MAG: TerB family tellurite resistance protein [Kofleriaceae bacterium]